MSNHLLKHSKPIVVTEVDVTNLEILQQIRSEHNAIWEGVIKLQEEQVKEALITLGWTPPKES